MKNIYKPVILIVDDLIDNLQLLESILHAKNYCVYTATSGVQAFKLLKTIQPDLILLDIVMPEMDGYEVCHHLKNNQATKNIPVIFITAKLKTEDRLKGFEAGALDYITKPFDTAEYIARVKTHVELKLSKDKIIDTSNRIQGDLQTAQQIQMRLLPQNSPKTNKLDIKSFSLMAKTVGGDFYYFHEISDDELLIAIGDISGKSMPAALIQAMALKELKHQMDFQTDPGKILTAMNNELFDVFYDTVMFCTIFVIKLNTTTGILEFSNGGHNHPLVYDSINKSSYEIYNEGVPLGFMRDTIYEKSHITIKPGDKILLYTDGLTEIKNKDDEFYSMDRLKNKFSQISPSPSSSVIKELLAEIDDYSTDEELMDDRTIIVVGYNKENS